MSAAQNFNTVDADELQRRLEAMLGSASPAPAVEAAPATIGQIVDLDAFAKALNEATASIEPAPTAVEQPIEEAVAEQPVAEEAPAAEAAVEQPAPEATPAEEVKTEEAPAAEQPKPVEMTDAQIRAGAEAIKNLVKDKGMLSHPLVAIDAMSWKANDVVQMIGMFNGHYKMGLPVATDENADLFRPAIRQMQEVLTGKRETPKAGKQPKKEGQPKAKSEKKDGEEKQPAAPKAAGTFPLLSTGVTLAQERTKKIPLPVTLFFEADPAGVTKPRGHQVDPSRVEACSPVMPNVELMEATGNPYPAAADETVETGEKYLSFVKISHLTFARLVADGRFDTRDKKLVSEIVAQAGVKEDYDALACVKDTLRDLALYGIAKQYVLGKSRMFRYAHPDDAAAW